MSVGFRASPGPMVDKETRSFSLWPRTRSTVSLPPTVEMRLVVLEQGPLTSKQRFNVFSPRGPHPGSKTSGGPNHKFKKFF